MPHPKINLLHHLPDEPSTPSNSTGQPPHEPAGHTKPPVAQPKKRRHPFRTAVIIVAVVLIGLFVSNVLIPGLRISASLGSHNLFEQLKHLTFSSDREVQGESSGRVNVLLLGIGGYGHDGPLLTDTIMIASLQPSTGKASLVSLPRDLLVPYPNGTWRKINEAYSIGETQSPGHGGEYASQVIGTVTGLDLPYYAVVDFKGFEKIVDQVGGIHVYVEKSFTDPTFPVSDTTNNVETVTFAQGWQWMNGQQALVYARSRHGNNGEGSDFARARRQQKVMLAVKDRALSSQILLNPFAINSLAGEVASHITTDLEPWQIWRMYSLGKDVNPENVVRVTPDDATAGLLVDGKTADGAFILQPRSGSFDELQHTIANVFSNTDLVQEPARVEVQNGTPTSGLGARVAGELTKRGYQVVAVTNAASRTQTETTLYDLTGGAKPQSLAALKVLYNARVVTSIPSWLLPTAEALDPNAGKFTTPNSAAHADFLLIIGSDIPPTVLKGTGSSNS